MLEMNWKQKHPLCTTFIYSTDLLMMSVDIARTCKINRLNDNSKSIVIIYI